MMDHPAAFLLSVWVCAGAPSALGVRMKRNNWTIPVEERGERCDGNAALKSRAKSAVSLRQTDPSIILSGSPTNPSAG